MSDSARGVRFWPYLIGIPVGLIAGFLLFLYLGSRNIDERTRQWVVAELSDRFDSQVDLQDLHVDLTPFMHVTGNGLTLRYHGRADVPPLIQIERFTFNLGLLGIIHVPRHIKGVFVEHMTITVPPSGDAKNSLEAQNLRPLPRVTFKEIVCDDTTLIILPKKEGKLPLDFEIHDLVLNAVAPNQPFKFRGTLTNATPKGEIATHGDFGPWNSGEPGETPVSGSYSFSDADLGPLAGIAGRLSSNGKYSGRLNQLEVQGETDTPNFSLDPVGRPVPLHTEFVATVDGTDGDTYLHPVRATLLQSLIIANGSVVRSPEKHGHTISLKILAPRARLQDILRLATKSAQPAMSGSINLKATMLLPAVKQKVLDKIVLDGDFGVSDAEFSSIDVREKLESLSRHGQGHPDNEDYGSSVTDLLGHFHLERELVTFKKLRFSVPGADIHLDGTYGLRDETVAFQGELRMQAKLSQTVTGPKSFFLKLADPFFKKEGAGSVVPIRITGTRDDPKFALALFGKK